MQPTKQNVAAVMNGLAKFFEYMVQTKSIDLKKIYRAHGADL